MSHMNGKRPKRSPGRIRHNNDGGRGRRGHQAQVVWQQRRSLLWMPDVWLESSMHHRLIEARRDSFAAATLPCGQAMTTQLAIITSARHGLILTMHAEPLHMWSQRLDYAGFLSDS